MEHADTWRLYCHEEPPTIVIVGLMRLISAAGTVM
jgi:hypothetical protein